MSDSIHESSFRRRPEKIYGLWKIAANILMMVFVVNLAGCASVFGSQKKLHGFSVENTGNSPIFNVIVKYGSITKDFCMRGCGPKVGTFYGAYIPIQDEMFVTWETANHNKHVARFPVKEKLISPDRLNSLMLYFSEDSLTVLQALEQEQKGAVGLEEYPLYKN